MYQEWQAGHLDSELDVYCKDSCLCVENLRNLKQSFCLVVKVTKACMMGSELDLFILTGLPATVVAVILASAIAVLYSKKSASLENSIQEWKFPHVTVENGNVIAAITQGTTAV